MEWRALLPYATAASRRQSRAACVTVQAVQAPLPPVLCGMTITPLQFVCTGKAPVLRAVYLIMSIALEKNSRQRFLYGETSTAPEQRRPEAIVLCFCFISELLIAAASCQT